MMNVVVGSSEYSSGCESGWTLYLEHSTSNFSGGYNNQKSGFIGRKSLQKVPVFQDHHKNNVCCYEQEVDDDDEEEEEDLSMVSDASSGPPHFDHDFNDDDDQDEDNIYYNTFNNNNNNNSNSNNNKGLRKQSWKSYTKTQFCSKGDDFGLDDTASSVIFTPKNNGDMPVGNPTGSSFDPLLDYSSQGYSATPLQGRSSNFLELYGYIQSPYTVERCLQRNQLS